MVKNSMGQNWHRCGESLAPDTMTRKQKRFKSSRDAPVSGATPDTNSKICDAYFVSSGARL